MAAVTEDSNLNLIDELLLATEVYFNKDASGCFDKNLTNNKETSFVPNAGSDLFYFNANKDTSNKTNFLSKYIWFKPDITTVSNTSVYDGSIVLPEEEAAEEEEEIPSPPIQELSLNQILGHELDPENTDMREEDDDFDEEEDPIDDECRYKKITKRTKDSDSDSSSSEEESEEEEEDMERDINDPALGNPANFETNLREMLEDAACERKQSRMVLERINANKQMHDLQPKIISTSPIFSAVYPLLEASLKRKRALRILDLRANVLPKVKTKDYSIKISEQPMFNFLIKDIFSTTESINEYEMYLCKLLVPGSIYNYKDTVQVSNKVMLASYLHCWMKYNTGSFNYDPVMTDVNSDQTTFKAFAVSCINGSLFYKFAMVKDVSLTKLKSQPPLKRKPGAPERTPEEKQNLLRDYPHRWIIRKPTDLGEVEINLFEESVDRLLTYSLYALYLTSASCYYQKSMTKPIRFFPLDNIPKELFLTDKRDVCLHVKPTEIYYDKAYKWWYYFHAPSQGIYKTRCFITLILNFSNYLTSEHT